MLDPRTESQPPAPGPASPRASVALVALAATAFVLLNLALYLAARSRLVEERWGQLAASAEEKRLDVADILAGIHRAAKFVASDDEARDWLRANPAKPGATPSPARSLEFERRLDHAASSFDLLAIEMVAADGTVFASSTNASLWRTQESAALARRVSRSRFPVTGSDHALAHGKPIIVVAAPVPGVGAPGAAAVALVTVGLEERLRSSLKDWVIRSPTAGAFVVFKDGGDVLVASQPPASTGLYLGQRLPLASARARGLATAAVGGESEIEMLDPSGRPMWSVTRYLPELGCGLVGQVDRATMLAGMRLTLTGLLVLDFGVALLALGVVLMGRRQFRARVAEREMALTRRHAERLQAVLETAFDAILTLDEDGRVLSANGAAVKLFGRPASTLDGLPLRRLMTWDGEGVLPDVAEHAVTPARIESLKADDKRGAVECTLARSSGDQLFYTLVVRDVSARVQADARIRSFAHGLEVSNRRLEEANGQLEQASRLKSEFLANTSHELRTPLNGIMGFLQLVLDGLCDSPEEERDFLRQALHCSKHLLGLINDVLDIAKIEAGRLSLQIEPIEIGAVFEEVYTVTHVQAQQKTLKLEFVRPDAEFPAVRGDFGKIKQVLINLVGNSLKFTPKGSITVRAHAHPEIGHVQIEIVDTGIGIPLDRQKQIFEKFTQADGSTTRRYGGTGLGLAITRSLVELMGGIIDVESGGPGTGARVYFSLPIWRGEDELELLSDSGESLLPDVIKGPQRGALVVVVDDDPVYRRMVTALLQHHGYRTAEAAHAEAGWVLVRRLRPALVVLDYALSCPEGALLRTGWDLAERMGSDERTRHIPYLFVTGFEQQLRDRLRGMTFARQPMHLAKPVRGEALLTTIVNMMGDMSDRVLRVLLADDDPMVAAYVSKVLPSAQFQIEVVNDGEECLHLLRTQPKGFDLLLLDLMMPGTSGYDVLREMALRGTAAALPVIVLTAHPDVHNEDERRLLEQGVVLEVLAKSDIHAYPPRLTQAIAGHLAAMAQVDTAAEPRLEVERFHAEIPEGDASSRRNQLGVEHLSDAAAGTEPPEEPGAGGREQDRRAA